MAEAGIAEGRGPRAVALDITGRIDRATGRRTGGILGLTSQQTQYVISARAELLSGDRAALQNYLGRTRRDKRYDRLVMAAMDAGKPLSAADVDRITGRYKDRLLQLRGETIARTESITALRAGRAEGYRQLVESGAVTADQITVTWSATGDARVRDIHRAMDGQKVKFGRLFTSPTGAQMEFPGDLSHGAHGVDVINCRCYAAYRIRFIE